jgi:hypothetical protein
VTAAFCSKKVPHEKGGVGYGNGQSRRTYRQIRGEASRLDAARAEGKSFEAKLALKTIKDECFHLRRFLHELKDAGRLD